MFIYNTVSSQGTQGAHPDIYLLMTLSLDTVFLSRSVFLMQTLMVALSQQTYRYLITNQILT